MNEKKERIIHNMPMSSEAIVFLFIYRSIKFAIKKPVEVDAKVVDTLPGMARPGWYMLRPVYEYEYNGEIYRVESPASAYDSVYDVPNGTVKLMINPDYPYEYLEPFQKFSKGTVLFIAILFVIFIILSIYLNVATKTDWCIW